MDSRLIRVGLGLAILALASPSLPSVATDALTGFARVIDGDTLEIDGQRIRLYGIDAPEAKQTCRRDGLEWLCGQEAAKALRARIASEMVTCQGRDLDRYGRIVAVCFLAGQDLNGWMVAEGWALAYRQFSKDYVPDEDAAREARRGLWRGEFIEPWEWRRGRR